MRKIVISAVPVAMLLIMGRAMAVTTVPSDYARDVQQGQTDVKNDPQAAANQIEVKDVENVEGNVDDGQVEVQEQVEPQEATEPAEAGDSSGPSSDGGSSNSSDTTPSQDSGTPAIDNNGGRNQ